jgi:PDDEXK-like domain of unknown function (DUF3799)
MSETIEEIEGAEATEAKPPPVFEPGIYGDIDEEIYHADKAISVSKLKLFADAPAKVLGVQKETTALRFGSLIHHAILEPNKVEAAYQVSELKTFNGTHKAYQAELQAAKLAGKTLVKKADMEAALRLRDVAHSHATVRELLKPEGLFVEQSFWWIDPATGLKRRGRTDIVNTKLRVLADLKSCESAHPDDFAKTIGSYKYHWQSAAYEDGFDALNLHMETLIFIAVEKEDPYLVAFYEIGDEDKQRARDVMARLLDRWAECERSSIWPGYDDRSVPALLPRWVEFEDQALLMPGGVR